MQAKVSSGEPQGRKGLLGMMGGSISWGPQRSQQQRFQLDPLRSV